MKKLLPLLFLLFPLSMAAENDSLHVSKPDTAVLMSKLEAYLQALDLQLPDEACAETDFIISSVADSVVRNAVAVKVYKHFRASKYMCSDNVAIYVFDRWFSKCRAVFDTLDEFDEATFHTFVNRASLVGSKAAELQFPYGKNKSVEFPAKGEVSAIYFYSTECPKCLYTSLKLKEYVNTTRPEISLYLVYTGDDDAQWKKYRNNFLNIKKSKKTRIIHLKGGDVDYVVPYSVTQTPRLLLVDGDGVIVGRMLDVEALSELLEMHCE